MTPGEGERIIAFVIRPRPGVGLLAVLTTGAVLGPTAVAPATAVPDPVAVPPATVVHGPHSATATSADTVAAAGLYGTVAGNRAAAQRTAARLLATVRLPAGAVRSATDPSPGGVLGVIGLLAPPGQLVDAAAWWTVDASGNAVIAAVRHSLPQRAIAGGVGTGAFLSWWRLPAGGALVTRAVAVQTDPLGAGVTAVRIDGEAIWAQPRPGWERVPLAPRSLTVQVRASRHSALSAPVIVAAAIARTLARSIDRLPVIQSADGRPCPGGPASPQLTLRFTAPGDGSTAVVGTEADGCLRLAIQARSGRPLTPRVAWLSSRLITGGVFPVCRVSQLHARVRRSGGTLVLTFVAGDEAACTLRGRPRVSLTSADDRPLVTHDRPLASSGDFFDGPPRRILLAPEARAEVSVGVERCPHAPRATGLIVDLPHVTTPLSVRLPEPLAVCHGILRIGALAAPARPVAPPPTRVSEPARR